MTTNSINNSSSSLTTTNVFTTNLSFDSGVTNMSAYSIGSFTPVLTFGGSSTGITYGTQTGTYIVVGNICNAYITIGLTNKGTATGNATITGFDCNPNNFLRLPIQTSYIVVGGMGPIVQISGTGVYELYYQESNNFITPLTNANFTNESQIFINFTYMRS